MAEPEWMTFDLGSSDEKFEFGGCDEIERMRNGKWCVGVAVVCALSGGWCVHNYYKLNASVEEYTSVSIILCLHWLAEMKAKLENHESNGDALRASTSTEELTAATEEPSATEEEVAPQFIESWEELDEDDVLEGDGAVRQSEGSGSAATVSGAADDRNGMGLTDDVLTQLLGFQLDDPEEESLVRIHVSPVGS